MSNEETESVVDAAEVERAAQLRQEHVAALKYERDGYKARGLADRVKEVDAQLRAFGEKPQGRQTPQGDTA